MAQYIVKGPLTGKWMRGPMEGATASLREAHLYHDGDPYFQDMVRYAKSKGVRLVLRQAWGVTILCPECRGSCDSREYPFYPCERCEGRGTISA